MSDSMIGAERFLVVVAGGKERTFGVRERLVDGTLSEFFPYGRLGTVAQMCLLWRRRHR